MGGVGSVCVPEHLRKEVRSSNPGTDQSPLKHTITNTISDPLCHCNNTHLHACFHCSPPPHISVIHIRTHTHTRILPVFFAALSILDAKPHHNLLQTKDDNDLFRQRKPELFCCFTCWIYGSHSLRVLMLHYGCVLWEHCIDYDVSALFFCFFWYGLESGFRLLSLRICLFGCAIAMN